MKSAASALGLMTLSVLCLLPGSVVSSRIQEERLFRDITRSYLKEVKPDDLVLKVVVSLICSRHDQASGELTTTGWEQVTWSDNRLSWNPKGYGGVESVRLPPHLIWTPDIRLYNSLTSANERDNVNVIVSSDGTVLWYPTVLYRTLCSSDSAGLKCQINLGSWTFDSTTVKLELDGAGISLVDYLNSTCPLSVVSAAAAVGTTYCTCCKEPYNYVEMNLLLKPNQF